MRAVIPNVCPRCANGRPGCTDRDADGNRFRHEDACATYQWAADVCDRCEPYVYGDQEGDA